MNIKIVFSIFFVVFSFVSGFAQSFVIQTKSNMQTKILLTEIQNFIFSDANLLHRKVGFGYESVNLSDVKKIYFEGVATAIENSESSSKAIFLYPNPTTDFLYFGNATPNLMLSIYRIDGSKVMQINDLEVGASVDVTSLSKGFYILKTNNQIFKFIKQ